MRSKATVVTNARMDTSLRLRLVTERADWTGAPA